MTSDLPGLVAATPSVRVSGDAADLVRNSAPKVFSDELDHGCPPLELLGDAGRQRVEGILQAVLAVSSSMELETTLGHIVDAAAYLVDAGSASFGVLGADGTIDRFVRIGPAHESVPMIGKLPTEQGVLDVRMEVLHVPVRARSQVFGHLYLSDRNGSSGFDTDDEILVRTLATAAGIAVGNALLYEEVLQSQRWLEVSAEITVDILDGNATEDSLRLIAERALELVSADHIGDPTSPLSQNYRRDRYGPAIALPLRAGESISGVLLAIRTSGAAKFSSRQLQIATSFTVQAALALQRAESQALRQEANVIAVREQIARDLHDQVIQRLFAIGLAMQGTQRRTDPLEISRRLDEHIDRMQEVIDDIRGTIFDLEIDSAQPPKLRVLLTKAVVELTEDSGVLPTVLISGPMEALTVTLRGHAQAVVREAVSNVVRHASATTVTVSIKVSDELQITVRDNGNGLPVYSSPRVLNNLRHRADGAGGSCVVENQVGGGSVLTWRAPLV